MRVLVSSLSAALCALAAVVVLAPTSGRSATDAATRLGEVRALLDGGDVAGAKARLGELGDAPGLAGEILERAGESGEACGTYAKDAKTAVGARRGAAHYRHALCLENAGADSGIAWQAVLDDSVLGHDVTVALAAARALDIDVLGPIAAGRLGWVLELEAHKSDTSRREAHAELLLLVAKYGSKAHQKRALERLYVDLAETVATKEALKLKEAARLARHKDKKLALKRADVLTDHHGNEELLETLARWRPKASDVSSDACKIRFLSGKAERKRRRYKSSRANLDFVADKCAEPWRKKARYLAARVASYAGNADALALLDAFIADYPKDGLADDVLLWKAEHFVGKGKLDEADRAYTQLIEQFSDGDMIDVARFDRAFLRARRGDVAGARVALDEIARQGAKAPVIVVDQALYWRARLQAMPKLESMTLSGSTQDVDEAVADLVALATSRPASFYGHLASLTALAITETRPELNGRVKADLAKVKVTARPHDVYGFASRRAFSGGASAGKDIEGLLLAGYGREAALLLDAKGRPKKTDAPTRAALYVLAGRLDRAHQTMRDAGYALPAGLPQGASSDAWLLAYPLAHKAPIAAATKKAELPSSMLLGLAREESAFDAAVVSWAGAIGLCQLMPFTAKEEAERARMSPLPDLAALRTPEVNAQLGANHLIRRWRQLKHPLLAIAAYNAGPGNVNKWRKSMGEVPLDTFVESIPVEQTRNYVKKVTGSWVVYSLLRSEAPVRYDLTLPPR